MILNLGIWSTVPMILFKCMKNKTRLMFRIIRKVKVNMFTGIARLNGLYAVNTGSDLRE